MNRYHFEVFPRWTLKGKRTFFRLVAGNGEIVAQSEGYVNRASAIHAIDRIKLYAATAPIQAVPK